MKGLLAGPATRSGNALLNGPAERPAQRSCWTSVSAILLASGGKCASGYAWADDQTL